MIQFQPEVVSLAQSFDPELSGPQTLGDLVSTLHDINSFFQDNNDTLPNHVSPSFAEAETRVADILGRSLNRSNGDLKSLSEYDTSAPLPTPFVGAFNISHSAGNGEMTPNSFTFAGDSSGSDQDDEADDKFTFEKFIPKSTRMRSPTNFLRRVR